MKRLMVHVDDFFKFPYVFLSAQAASYNKRQTQRLNLSANRMNRFPRIAMSIWQRQQERAARLATERAVAVLASAGEPTGE